MTESKTTSNPIYEQFFKGRAALSGKVFDEPRSVQFRKQLATNGWLRETKPSSIPTAGQIERRGHRMTHHVLWLREEADALRNSLTYRDPLRAGQRTLAAENGIKRYLNQVHTIVRRLKTI